MRKLKLQMQVTVDGYVAGPEGQLDWMPFDMDAGLLAFINHLTDTSDTILLGRKMTDGFIKYWEQVVTQKDTPERAFAQKMVGLPKVVFSKTRERVEGRNVRVENGDLADAVKQLKSRPGKDLIVYGGAAFVFFPVQHRPLCESKRLLHPLAGGGRKTGFDGAKPRECAASPH